MVDAFHAMEQFDRQFESVKQAAVADRIVLTKTDVADADGNQPVVVHAVHHMFHPPAKIGKWPGEDRRSRLVFIVRDLEKKTMESVMNSYLALEFA